MIGQHAMPKPLDASSRSARAFAGSVAVSDSSFREALESRRVHLQHARTHPASHDEVRRLLAEVDAALVRLEHGTFGICETCHEPIEADRLVRDPLVRLCGEHPGEDEAERLGRDLALARAVQRRLLPSPHTVIPGWRFHYRYAAAGDVGGDYLDVIENPNSGETLVLLGDVSGKGVAASMLMAHLHATFRSLAPLAADTGDLLARANDLFSDSAAGSQYATLLVASLGRDRTVSVYSAGHWPPLLLRGTQVEPLAVDSGLPFGMFPASRYAPTRLTLGDGDTLLFYTDGASEARDGNEGEFGHARLAEVMAAAAPGASPFDIVETCFEVLRRFGGGARAHDDLTLLSIAAQAGLETPRSGRSPAG